MKFIWIGLFSLVAAGCGGRMVYSPMAGYTPDVPLAMAEANCRSGVRKEAQDAINSARASARSNNSWTHTAACNRYGSYANCTGSSYQNDTSGYAALGAALGAAMSKNRRMKDCMATYGYSGREVDKSSTDSHF